MTTYYVSSVDGNDADGLSWATAKVTLAGAAAIDAAGDNIYLSQAHSETSATAITIALAGTLASPSRLLCVDDTAEPPTTPATGAVIATSAAVSITISAAAAVVSGLDLRAGSAGLQASLALGIDANYLSIVDTLLSLTNSSVNSAINFGASGTNADTRVLLDNVGFKLGNASQKISVINSSVDMKNCRMVSGGTSPTYIFLLSSSGGILTVDGFDSTACSAGVNLFGPAATFGKGIIRNSKLPASWSGALVSALPTAYGCRFEMHNCTDGTNDYLFQSADYAGTIKDDRVVTCTGGANDGSGYSFKLVSSANSSFPAVTLDTPEFSVWNTSTTAVTATAEIVRDSATALTDGEIWLEVSYIGASGQAFATDAKASVFATAADQATSTASWTTTGLSAPLKQKLSVTFTPEEAGFIQAKVRLAKPSTTVYVDPKLTVA